MDYNHKPRRLAALEAEEVDGEIVIYQQASDKVIHLNDTAALVWRLCTGDHPVAAIIKSLCDMYPHSAREVRAEVPTTLQRLTAEGVIEWL